MRLLGARIEVKIIKSATIVGSSIKLDIPDSQQKESQFGYVGLIGDEASKNLKEGDRILFATYALPDPIDMGDGTTMSIINEEDVILVM